MRRLALLLTCSLTFGLTACISSNGITPETSLPDETLLSLSADQAHFTDDAAWPNQTWWHQYHDKQLNALMQEAVNDSPSIEEANARLRMALAIGLQTDAALLPSVSADATINRKKWPSDSFYGPGELSGTSSWNNVGLISFYYDPDIWDKNTSLSDAALSRIKKQIAETQIATLNIESSLMHYYIQLSLACQQRDIGEQVLATYQDRLDIMQAQLEMGLSTKVMVHQAEVSLSDAQVKLASVIDRIDQSKHAIAAILGKSADIADHLQPPHIDASEQDVLPSHIPAELLGHRPDVVASRWLVASKSSEIDAAQADFYPDIDLTAAVGFMSVTGGMLSVLSHEKLTYNAGPAISLPIFDAGRIRAQLKQRDAEYDVAVSQYKSTLSGAIQDISDSLSAIHTAQQQLNSTDVAMKASEANVAHAMDAYDVGLTDYLPIVDAKLAAFQQRLLKTDIQAEVLAASVALNIALGGGLVGNEQSPKVEQIATRSMP